MRGGVLALALALALAPCADAQPLNATLSSALRKLAAAPPLAEVVSCSASTSVMLKWCAKKGKDGT